MPCCGQKRQRLEPGTTPGVMLEYRERRAVQVQGTVTGRTYVFSPGQPIQTVDRRDAPGLLRSVAFRQR